MKKVQVTPAYIKEYIEQKTGIDVSIKSRKRHIVYLRFVAFRLSRDFEATLSEIGEPYGRDHATILHGLKQFEIHKEQGYFQKYNTLYYEILAEISEIVNLKPSLKRLQTIEEVKREYQFKFNDLSSLYRTIIRKQRLALERYENDEIFQKISELPEEQFNELKERINAFLIMNKSKLLING